MIQDAKNKNNNIHNQSDLIAFQGLQINIPHPFATQKSRKTHALAGQLDKHKRLPIT
jgi:hypothetical protein